MSTTSTSMNDSRSSQFSLPHLHEGDDVCPLCDQAIPHDRFDEIKERIEAREKAATAEIAKNLSGQHARETAEAVEAARREASVEIEREKQESATRIAAAKAEAQQAAEAAASAQIANAELKAEAQRAELTAKLGEAEKARQVAQASHMDLAQQLETERSAGKAAVEKVRAEAAAKEVLIREVANRNAEAQVREQVAGIEAAHRESEGAMLKRATDAETAIASVQEERAAAEALLDQTKLDSAAALEKANADAAAREAAAREDSKRLTEAALQGRINEAERAKTGAETKAAAAEEAARVLKETHESQIEARVSEVRTALEGDKVQAVNAAKAEAYEDKLKLSEQLADVQRKLDKKAAEELGEGAEVNLFEALQEVFKGDKIERVGRGNPGADIIHVVVHNGMECGKIIYDSKDHSQWRYDFVTKLASDKIAAKADHAILSVRKFPQGARQLHVHDGVILANPARVVALVEVVREHIVKSHTLRMSNEAKLQKSAELYTFITSAQFTDLLDRIDTHAQELQGLQDDERKAHETVWKKQSIRFRSIQKAGGDLSNRIDIILGTAGNVEKAVNDE